MKEPIVLSRRGRVAHVECRWARGRIDEDASQGLCAVAEELELDRDAAVVVLEAAGGDFCLGFDGRRWGATLDCIAAVAHLPQPVIAVVHGRASAEGCELALACDLRLVGDDASF